MKTVLFAEDNRAVREMCQRVLQDEGYRVVLARDGREAIRVADAEHPDVAILDVHMPRISGLQAAADISAVHPEIPIILYTANDDICTHDDRAQLAMACIEKSGDFTELALAVSRALAPGKRRHPLRLGLPPRGR